MENFLFTIPVLGLVAVLSIPLWAYLSYKSHNRKLRRIYNEIKIGDRYQFTIPPMHPFDELQVYKATIIGKALAGGKSPWVQYRYDDGSVSQDELGEFLTWHEAITD
jgi:hypothetical protein